MKQETVALVQESWKKVDAISPQLAELFYQNLFAADPSLKSLFKRNMKKQGVKLTNMFNVIVRMLNNLEILSSILKDLAENHVHYGVHESHYQTVGDALIKTLEQSLGEDFTPEVKDAWREVYSVMSEAMISA